MNQNNENNQNREFSLPPLLSGSEYKSDDSDVDLVMNLLGLAVAIIVCSEKDKASEDRKKEWLGLFEQESEKAVQYMKNNRDFYRKHPLHNGHRSPDTGREDWYQKMILAWLKNFLFKAPDWHGLYTLIGIHKYSLKKDLSADWWKVVQSICKRAETSVYAFDPIAEIWKVSEEYRTQEEPVRQNETGDNDAKTDAEEPEQELTQDIIKIPSREFSKGVGYRLLCDLIKDDKREGVREDAKENGKRIYGERVPKTCKELLKTKAADLKMPDLVLVAEKIKPKKEDRKYVFLDMDFNKVVLD